ncbi:MULTISPECIES: DNA polymerase III subunit chi [unclassified Undibacterium]|uniref:DNA polymerase III subunit chi n=1 Tax=unclassified Undibacterium TaxID=2630295 RepID=UPI003C300FF7
MTRIDFHSNVADKLHYACRLIRKARAANSQVVVYHDDLAVLRHLDEALWTISEADFLPHVMADDVLASMTPIILSHTHLDQSPHFELLVNLSAAVPEHFSRFGRMIEIVSGDQQDTQAARERYRYYQQQGHSLNHNVAK